MDKGQIDLYISDSEARKGVLKDFFEGESLNGIHITQDMQTSIIGKICSDVFDSGVVSQDEIQEAKKDDDAGEKNPDEISLDDFNATMKYVLMVIKKKM